MTTLRISTDPAELDVPLIHQFLSEQSTWAVGLPLAVLERAIGNSLCFGLYLDERQAGFARVVSDYATYASLVDVFVVPEFRGNGYARRLLEAVMAHPDLQGLRRFTVAGANAQRLYARFGFAPPTRPAALMERHFPDLYKM